MSSLVMMLSGAYVVPLLLVRMPKLLVDTIIICDGSIFESLLIAYTLFNSGFKSYLSFGGIDNDRFVNVCGFGVTFIVPVIVSVSSREFVFFH